MNNWEKVTLGRVCIDVFSGGTPKSTNNDYYNNGQIPWLNTKEINFNRIFSTEKNITELGYNNSSTKWVPENSVIVAMYGATAAKVCVNKIKLTTNQACCNLVINKNIADYRYIYYNINNNYIPLSSLANGGAQQNLNSLNIKNFEINLPPLDEQKRIADVLSALDDKIEINNKINENLEAQAQAIFKQWFVDFEFPDEEGKLYKTNGGKLIDSELGEIPEGWKVGTLGEFIHFIKGKKPKNIVEEKLEGYELYLTIDALTSYNSTYSEIEKNVLVNELDLLMVMDGASSGTMHFGKKGIVGSTLSKIQLIDNNYSEIIYRCLKYYESEIKSHTTGSAIPHTDKNYVLQLPFIHPNKIMPCCNFFINIREQQIINQKENYRLSEIRDSLLPRLMSGEVRV